jgi:8-oxo-dGTP diphosphatase
MKRSVAGIAITQDKVFIARRKAGGDIGKKWEFPGGKVEEGESDADALRREFLEEFNVVVTVGPLLASGEFFHNGQKFALNGYRIFFDSPHFNLTEHDECRWAALDELETLDFTDSDRQLFPPLFLLTEGVSSCTARC